jgi:hypothetical protein
VRGSGRCSPFASVSDRYLWGGMRWGEGGSTKVPVIRLLLRLEADPRETRSLVLGASS